MSSTTNPISPTRFAAALSDLSLASLHAKASEIRNSILHLRISNSQLEPFAADGDADCMDAIKENEAVMDRMRERVELLRTEVEGRGARWVSWDEDAAVAEESGTNHELNQSTSAINGHVNGLNGDAGVAQNGGGRAVENEAISGRFSDEELTRRLRAQMDPEGDDDEGLHL